ncbi:LysR family transcriptional regulator [Roseibium denhamense]|uniref:Transcriptional regulator, LysR family n=1 Tax=Roseibium denhamense TaxID=76305 RepID=A0ABY1NVW8_9HYPH|nr:LysR family transcriptional regulator [Roseibium denhamense]MTI05476.1 LysR family transcriptional regulator [Roseibium denhamense]SMP18380.1 transcriptional regulator, LysR family [Roseibium denhamense]
MRFDDLQFFERVAVLGSLSAAGREFGLSPSASSTRLSNLEKELGTQLVARTTRRTSLTEAGEVFLKHSRVALQELSLARSEISASEEAPRGTLRISSNVFFGRKHMLPYLAEFRQLHPDLRLEINMTDRLVDLVGEGYDMAIRGAPLPDSSLMARKLGGNPRVLCASPAYLDRKGVPETPEDLRRHDCIGFDPMRVWYFKGPDGEVPFQPDHPVVSGDSGDFAYDAAVYGLGLTVKSMAHVWEDLRDGKLVEVMTRYPVARTGNIYAVYPPAKFVAPKISAFVDFLISKYGRPPYWESDYRDAGAVNLGIPAAKSA